MKSYSTKSLTDINGMLIDSNINVLQSNYSYILWSILGLGVLFITIKSIKK